MRDVAFDYLALGLDSAKANFFRQSDVPEVCELAWVLSNVCGMGLLERVNSYKDKVANGITPNVGLFTYPVLMAADILIYRSHLVPVGKDQEQHLEMAPAFRVRSTTRSARCSRCRTRFSTRRRSFLASAAGEDEKELRQHD